MTSGGPGLRRLCVEGMQYAMGHRGQHQAYHEYVYGFADHAVETEYRTVARLRLAGMLMDAKQYEGALKTLDAAASPAFEALVDDRRGDALLAMGRKDEARAAYEKAWKTMDSSVEYRRLIEAKLAALGAATTTAATPASSASGARP